MKHHILKAALLIGALIITVILFFKVSLTSKSVQAIPICDGYISTEYCFHGRDKWDPPTGCWDGFQWNWTYDYLDMHYLAKFANGWAETGHYTDVITGVCGQPYHPCVTECIVWPHGPEQ